MSLRARLVVTTLALFTVGLLVAGVATYGFLRSFLVHRVDQQLIAVRAPAIRGLFEAVRAQSGEGPPRPLGGFGGPGGRTAVPPGTYAELRDSAGHRLAAVAFGFQDTDVPSLSLPARLATTSVAGDEPHHFTVGLRGHGGYRATAQTLVDGTVVVVAVPMHDVRTTLGRLVAVEVGVAIGVLVAIAGASLVLIRRGLRPLDDMGETAGAIAAGDLARRVGPSDGRTEIGRLGAALNAMLTQIEAAFAERRAIEARLRRFLIDASHELRTPLTSIRGWAELFRRGAHTRPDDLARSMRRIEDEAAHMGGLVEDMLSLARLDQPPALAAEPVELTELAADAVDDARAVEPDRPISLDTPDPVSITADATRMRQVFANLLSNARDHTPRGTPVHVRVAQSDSTAIIEVSDEGPGMRPEDSARAFERFYRADPARSRANGGAGLGLAIVAAIAEAHGGSADVISAPGGGACFRVSLPTG